MIIPKYIFLTKGSGKHSKKLGSFEVALRMADITQYNLVNVSSIIPPKCELLPKSRGLTKLKSGQIVYCVLSKLQTNEPERLITAAVGLAIPRNQTKYGYISEYHAYGKTEEIAGKYAEDLAAEMLYSSLGNLNDNNLESSKQEKKIFSKDIQRKHICASDKGDKEGLWTTVVAAAIFI